MARMYLLVQLIPTRIRADGKVVLSSNPLPALSPFLSADGKLFGMPCAAQRGDGLLQRWRAGPAQQMMAQSGSSMCRCQVNTAVTVLLGHLTLELAWPSSQLPLKGACLPHQGFPWSCVFFLRRRRCLKKSYRPPLYFYSVAHLAPEPACCEVRQQVLSPRKQQERRAAVPPAMAHWWEQSRSSSCSV